MSTCDHICRECGGVINCQHCKPYSLPADRARIAELEALLSVSRDLNRKYVDALRKVADHKATVGPLDSAEDAMASYSIALADAKLIAQQALPITETR